MTFIHPLLLGGLLLAGIPVLIHMMMRQKPKRLRFPALRFLQQRYVSNSRRLRLRHLLLLALRVALVALVCLALARPRLFSEKFNFTSDQPVAAILVFDTTPSMEYSVAGQTRLAESKMRAVEILRDLPDGSRVAILDSADLSGEWLPSIDLARERIDALQVRHARPRLRRANRSITRPIDQAYRMFAKLGDEDDAGAESWPKFLYVFSDRTTAAWDASEIRDVRQPDDVHALFIDVGVDNPRDLAITRVGLPEQPVTPGDRIPFPVTVQATGGDPEAREIEVRFRIVGEQGWEHRSVRLRPGETRDLLFERRAASRPGTPEQVPGLGAGLHQVEVELATTDAMPFDNVYYGTFRVREPRKVLVLTDHVRQGEQLGDADFWRFDLEYLKMFQCDVKPVVQVGDMQPDALKAYDLICLVDVARPAENRLWPKLLDYVKEGHGLVIVPGGEGWELDRNAYNEDPVARQLMPARLEKVIQVPRESPGVPWTQELPSHPFLEPFRQWRKVSDVDFQQPERLPRATGYWEVTPYPEDVEKGAAAAKVIIHYDDPQHRPALVERPFGRGKVFLFTTPFDGRRDIFQREWNNYAQSSFSRVLINLVAAYLVGDIDRTELNYPPGQVVRIPVSPGSRTLKYTLLGPQLGGSDSLLERNKDQAVLEIDQAVTPGNYTLLDTEGNRVAGFSIFFAPQECQLTRADPAEIKQLLGPDALVPIGQSGSLREALQSRWPQPVELFFWLMILVLLLLAVENLLANKFYRRSVEKQPEMGGAAVPVAAPERAVV